MEKAKTSQSEYESKRDIINDGNLKEPTQEIKMLYRKLAKKFHPDITLNLKEKERRSQIMAQINDAYSRGDFETLSKLDAELRGITRGDFR